MAHKLVRELQASPRRADEGGGSRKKPRLRSLILSGVSANALMSEESVKAIQQKAKSDLTYVTRVKMLEEILTKSVFVNNYFGKHFDDQCGGSVFENQYL